MSSYSIMSGLAPYRRAAGYFRDLKGRTILALALTLLAIGLNLLKPWPVKLLIDGVVAPTPGADLGALGNWLPTGAAGLQIGVLSMALVVIHLVWGLANLSGNYLLLHTGLLGVLRLRTDLYSALQSLPLRYHDERRSSDSSFRVAYDSQSIQTIYNRGLGGIFSSMVMLVGVFGIMLTMDWKLTLISLSIVPAVIVAIRHYAVRIRSQSTEIHERESAVLDVAQEGLRSIRMVHAFTQEEHEVSQFKRTAERSLAANLKFNMTTVSSTLVSGALMAIGTAAMYWVGSSHVLEGSLKIGDLVVFAAYLAMLYGPLESLTYTAWALESAAAGAQRCFEVLDSVDDVADVPDAHPLPEGDGRVEFCDVVFRYRPDDERAVLDGVSFVVEPGSTLAIVGGTGAGKSTILSLIPRFYAPDAGKVRVNGVDIREVQRASLRRSIGVVLQDTLLFSSSVRENIAYGRMDASEEEIIEAARKANAHDFIMKMPQGYDSSVGERGAALSVGQRQRIGIARAFLKNAPILLLDEPTSALDPSTEQSVMTAISELMRGRTTVIVTHRIQTVHNADCIVVLRDGKIVEQGTGPELVARGGDYARLYRDSQGA